MSANKMVTSRNPINAINAPVKRGTDTLVSEMDNSTDDMLSRMFAFVSAI